VAPKSGEKAVKHHYSLRTGSVSYHYPFPLMGTLASWRIMEKGLQREGTEQCAHLVRSAIEGCQDVEIVGEASDGEDAVRQTATLAPELIIMDLSMPVLDGLSAAEIIKTYYPETRILMFSMHKLRDLIDIAKNSGMNGYVSKKTTVRLCGKLSTPFSTTGTISQARSGSGSPIKSQGTLDSGTSIRVFIHPRQKRARPFRTIPGSGGVG